MLRLEYAKELGPRFVHGLAVPFLAPPDDRQRVGLSPIGYIETPGLCIAERDPVAHRRAIGQRRTFDSSSPANGDQ